MAGVADRASPRRGRSGRRWRHARDPLAARDRRLGGRPLSGRARGSARADASRPRRPSTSSASRCSRASCIVTTEITTDGRNPTHLGQRQLRELRNRHRASRDHELVRLAPASPTQIAELPTTASWRSTAPARARTRPWLRESPRAQAARRGDARRSSSRDCSTTGRATRRRGSATGASRRPTGRSKSAPALSSDDQSVVFLGADEQDLTRSDIFVAGQTGTPARVTDQPGHKTNIVVAAHGGGLVYSVTNAAPFRTPGSPAPGREGGRGAAGGGGGRAGAPAGGAPGGGGALRRRPAPIRAVVGAAAARRHSASSISRRRRRA